MKKKLLFVLVLFMALTSFKNNEIEKPRHFEDKNGLSSTEIGPPWITYVTPMSRKIKVLYGMPVFFWVEYVSNPAASAIILKDGKEVLNSKYINITFSKNKVIVSIDKVEFEDEGTYTVVLINRYGEVRVSFTLIVTEYINQ